MENLMQYVWQHRLWPPGQMSTVDGRQVTVIDSGQLNTGSGPDFFNAKVRIGDRLWAGDVEIHVRAGDWYRHGHDKDRAYDSVVLHVVARDDMPVRRYNGEVIPQMVMACSPELSTRYSEMLGRASVGMPCADEISHVSSLHLNDWLTSLALERIYDKADRIGATLRRTAGDWETACFVTVARALGFGINGDPLERTAMSLSLSVLAHHSDSTFALEALLFGQSGLLDTAPECDYAVRLSDEYRFLAAKYGLRPVVSPGWKTGRIRPANQPHRRIALLATLCHGGFAMAADIACCNGADDARRLFRRELTGFWTTHYGFGTPSATPLSPCLSRTSIDTMVINVVAPFIVARGLAVGDDDAVARAVALLESLPPERNSVVGQMESAGICVRDALASQAVLQLRRRYCEARKCIYCRIGHRRLSRFALMR